METCSDTNVCRSDALETATRGCISGLMNSGSFFENEPSSTCCVRYRGADVPLNCTLPLSGERETEREREDGRAATVKKLGTKNRFDRFESADSKCFTPEWILIFFSSLLSFCRYNRIWRVVAAKLNRSSRQDCS